MLPTEEKYGALTLAQVLDAVNAYDPEKGDNSFWLRVLELSHDGLAPPFYRPLVMADVDSLVGGKVYPRRETVARCVDWALDRDAAFRRMKRIWWFTVPGNQATWFEIPVLELPVYAGWSY